MRAYVGTSGWSYEAWKGSWYPADLATDAMLGWYAGRLASVECNATFYRLPKRDMLRSWREQVPDGFSFVLKASRRITHQAKLGADAREPLAYLCDTAGELGESLGPILFQTPPWLKKDLALLRDFLDLLPEGVRAAFEFRSTTWFDEPVHTLLGERGAALVATDTGDEAKDAPLVATASWGYVRLRRERYEDGALEAWADRLAGTGWDDMWAFFKHEDEGAGPRLAERFARLLAG